MEKPGYKNRKVITEKDLESLGFYPISDPRYINGTRWVKQIRGYFDGKIDRDGTWFDAVGTYSFKKTGEMAVNLLCRGNYVCSSITTLERLRLVHLALTEEELKIETITEQ